MIGVQGKGAAVLRPYMECAFMAEAWNAFINGRIWERDCQWRTKRSFVALFGEADTLHCGGVARVGAERLKDGIADNGDEFGVFVGDGFVE